MVVHTPSDFLGNFLFESPFQQDFLFNSPFQQVRGINWATGIEV